MNTSDVKAVGYLRLVLAGLIIKALAVFASNMMAKDHTVLYMYEHFRCRVLEGWCPQSLCVNTADYTSYRERAVRPSKR